MTDLIRPLAVLSLGLGLTACGPTANLQPEGGGWGDAPAVTARDYQLRDPGPFSLTGQESLAEAAEIIRGRLATRFPVAEGPTETLNVYSAQIIGQDRGAVVFTLSGLQDDAVEAEQYVAEFAIDPETDAASVTAFGSRQTCRRGADAGSWTNQPCP